VTPQVLADEVEITAIRAQGAGGQNVNKVSSAVHLRYDVAASSLPDDVKARLLALRDQRITSEGVVVIKAQQYRSQELNRGDALLRLQELVDSVAKAPRVRRPTKPTRGSQQRRLAGKSARSEIKSSRGKVSVLISGAATARGRAAARSRPRRPAPPTAAAS
jgi:ribosome-associated protein